MREILFRGKRKDNSQWVEGYLIKIFDDRVFIISEGSGCFRKSPYIPYKYEVDPETVGQYTGRNDKHDKKIWERDLIKDGDEGIWIIRWDKEDACFVFQNPMDKGNYNTLTWLFSRGYLGQDKDRQNIDTEVIGNIHDNHELITQ